MMVSMKFTPTGPTQNPQQKMMMRIMPIFFGFISYPFAAGLNLYVLTSTVLGILQSRLIRATDIAGPKVVKAPATSEGNGSAVKTEKPKSKQKKRSRDGQRKKPQHFYDRAQQRKRELAKAGRKKSRRK